MSLYIDLKYLKGLSHRLEMFKDRGNHLYNCRCSICGDSQRNKRKARGYFYRKKNDMFYKCHNCSVSQSFGTFLKNFDSEQYKQYVFERYAAGEGGVKSHTKPVFKFEAPVFNKPERLLDKIMDRLDSLPEDNEAVLYALGRQIPRNVFSRLYFIDNIKNIAQLNDKYKASIITEEPRLALPFLSETGNLMGVALRAMRGETLRYITIKIDEDAPTVFGLDQIDKNKTVTVVEGPIDSLFLENCIACAGTSFNKIDTLSLNDVRIVFDNQPKNKEVCKLISKYIALGYAVCLWPENVVEKDINEMILAGRSKEQIENIIDSNTVKGLEAEAKFMMWKKC